MASRAVMMLFEDLKSMYNVEYILTTRLNQDVVENLFSQLRYSGGSDPKFGALKFRQLLRDFILGATQFIPSSRGASVEDASDPMLSDLGVHVDEDSLPALLNDVGEPLIQESGELIQAEPKLTVQNADGLEEIIDALERNPASIPSFQYDLPQGKPKVTIQNADELEEITDVWEGNSDTQQNASVAMEEGINALGSYLGRDDPMGDLACAENSIVDEERSNFVNSKWLQLQGGSNPSTSFRADLVKMDKLFNDHHKSSEDGLLRSVGVVQGFLDILMRHFDHIELKILKKFAMARTIFRLRNLLTALMNKTTESRRSKTKIVDYIY